ncbi:hypothetical protein [Streptomyces griseorubiginosus]|uniref:hypothetical protein n=1 Tax=Streptomyces griseorubiginosus TaxID=67304 RepID=UPI0036E24BD5
MHGHIAGRQCVRRPARPAAALAQVVRGDRLTGAEAVDGQPLLLLRLEQVQQEEGLSSELVMLRSAPRASAMSTPTASTASRSVQCSPRRANRSRGSKRAVRVSARSTKAR